MRTTLLLLIVVALLQSGCAACIVRSGTDIYELKTRDQVRTVIGEPLASGIDDDGDEYEDFSYHGKIADQSTAYWVEGFAYYTLGLGDLFMVPAVIGTLGHDLCFGRDVRVYYDNTGKATAWHVKGTPWGGKPLRPSKSDRTESES